VNRDTGGQAFPKPPKHYSLMTDRMEEPADGMSLLDWFAGMAMQGVLSNQTTLIGLAQRKDGSLAECIANYSYTIAEAIIAKKRKHEQDSKD